MTKAFWKYYFDLTKFNAGISLLTRVVTGWQEGILLFVTGGMLLSLIAYSYFHHNEYYLYHNLGLTRMRLALTSWLVNLGVGVVLFVIFVL